MRSSVVTIETRRNNSVPPRPEGRERDQTVQTAFSELAHRADGGVDVTLLWSERENRLAVIVSDSRSGELFVLDAENDKALDLFYHPYAHAAFQAAT